ncbi:LysR family transcriptional regulator [Marinobacterium rhizophilum]|uniref:LysR family transcriptional regulator n=1 Tax=Marinobacterium rhizophilum TaxID=420402 RepID=A0ABY5HHA3_9GAMM|nr:LysR family transcriptional regulator [Marinobacterium rhizophilum]UTW11730.1 LysR family transcriptional regulator [Marinobacterium rhizophilum]
MAALNQLESLRIFRAVVECGNFTAAAKRLDCTTAWVSKAINRLEAELENTLFQRSTRHIRLTAAGERCYQHALHLLDGWKALEDDLSREKQVAAGRLNISIPMSWGLSCFGALSTQFMQRYPGIELNVQLSDDYVNVLEDRFDLVLRLATELSDSSLICQRLASYRHITCAAPAYLERYGRPSSPSELGQHQCLVFARASQASPWRFRHGMQRQDIYPSARMVSNNSMLLRQALLAGEGIAFMLDFLVDEDLAAGRLVPLLQEFQAAPLNLYALMVKTSHQPYPLQLLRQFLRQQLSA